MDRYEIFVNKVLDYAENGNKKISHSELIMVAFALNIWMRKNFLPEYVMRDPYGSWDRLDDVQKKVVEDFRSEKHGVFCATNVFQDKFL
ncbi:MAG: hypothetical protein KUA37_06815 [Desulfomicrobium sp.]|nr:hypothetical protein [Pseudomonadota bacterium]MBV1711703.1 hypothetical protein [Desulfomicrobium sp.]MBU4572709.1 hypothetical protein [Pseudomonadota bacterium]MBU4593510.1 hypothetical protein [Pseudomonadota bacterium]MBV1720432.1 hypothetical protein [Desulfomicrobium sp.]